MATAAKLDLSQIWVFSTCSKAELTKIRRAFTEVTVEAGRLLCEEGAPGEEFFIILSGTADVIRNGRKVNTLGPGQFFGELALLDHRPRSATVRAASEMTVLVLAQREFTGLLAEVPGLTKKLLQAVAGRLRAADSKAFH
ncbi:MAG: cyclic nucleotide-binding domain-containing protein [Acidimicrobiales bacterium]|nr:cyclic nucleotide-binding domain-containing protein [Acidimicrobiales bacterium]